MTVAPVLCLNTPCFGQAAHRVTAVRFWSAGDTTRIAVEVSGEFKYKSDNLDTPPRLFFDVQSSRPAMAQKTIPVGDHLLKQIRIAETQPGTTRVVLDLEQAADFTASQLSNPERLMIELHAKGAKTSPAAASTAAVSTSVVEEPAKPLPAPKPQVEPPAVAKKVDPPVVAKVLPSPAVLTPVSRPVVAPRKPDLAEPKAAARTSSGDRTLTRALGLKLGRVVLDPGHGGHDAGTHGPSGLTEKDLVLDVSQRLAMLLQDRLGSEVVLTRTDDTFVPLEGRTKIANDAKADLFLSIHANSSPVKSVTGVETYYLNFTTSRSALDLAARENAPAESSIFDLKDVLEKIALKDKIDESREFAARLQTSLFTLTKSAAATKNRGIKKAPFVVLIGAQMPSVLAEIGFLTNSADEALMRKTDHRQKIAEALYKGIAAYAESLSQLQVAKRE
ncbi:MAG: N-acetylmuramoyl-L-alanine amidase [Acidobacteriia bacterium]|nr:N-acetylmuramoyl-L-alanine amidase [Terriglobia bacterium]